MDNRKAIENCTNPQELMELLAQIPNPKTDSEYSTIGMFLEMQLCKTESNTELHGIIYDKLQEIDEYYTDNYEKIEHDSE